MIVNNPSYHISAYTSGGGEEGRLQKILHIKQN